MPTTDEQIQRLHKKLQARRDDIGRLCNYYDGYHPEPTAPRKTDEFRRLWKLAQTSVCALVVDSIAERLELQGVRFSGSPTEDLAVWSRLWQANRLDADSGMVHTTALTVGRAFVLVWPSDDGVQITPEDPFEVIVDYAPGSRRRRTAALKEYVDPDAGKAHLTYWTPDGIHYRQRDHRSGMVSREWSRWGGPDDGEPDRTNPLGTIPVVEFQSRPHMSGRVMPELSEDVLRIQDRVNKTCFDQVVLAEYQAFPQRYSIGIQVELDEHGNPVNPLKKGPDRTWAFEGDKNMATIGQLPAADLGGHLKAIEADIQRIAAITKIPVYYLMGQMVNISADAIRAAEAGLVKKAISHQREFGESWEDVLRLALSAEQDPRTTDVAVEMTWRDPESRSTAEAVDAATKKAAIGVPFDQVAEDIGYSPQQVARFRSMRAAQALTAATFALPLAPPAPPAPSDAPT